MCTNTNKDQDVLLDEQQKLNTEMLELREWFEQRRNNQTFYYDQMVVYYDRMLTKCSVYEVVLERARTENARFKFTSQCLMGKIKELTSSGVEKSSINSVGNDNDQGKDGGDDSDNDNDTDPIATYLEACSRRLVDDVMSYKQQVEKTKTELDDINEQLAKSAETQVCLRRGVDELTVLAERERMKRDRDELELRTTVDQLTAELDEVQQEMARLQSVEVKMSVKLMNRESAQDELDEVLRTENARLHAQLGRNALVEAALQSKVHDLELELTKVTGVAQLEQGQCQDGFGSESIDSSSTSMILDHCNLSQMSNDQKSSFMDLGSGDDQLIPSLMSSTKSCAVKEDDQLSCSQSTIDDRQSSYLELTDDYHRPSCLELTDDDHRPSSPRRTTVQDSAETVSEPSREELRNRRLAELIKQYGSKHDNDS
ncbi:hypothetical protein ACI65C_009207 [Semiaphis heraclei]